MKQKREAFESVVKNENFPHTAPAKHSSTFSVPSDEKVLHKVETLCTICAEIIHEYVPKFILEQKLTQPVKNVKTPHFCLKKQMKTMKKLKLSLAMI